ncbi:undecaprenyl-diphosphate phosphatase [Tabrizicola sp.]|uniref:undecaprenyl-diphosphate phosphatase n=1 Tax=Tabrizicola sp. TaxID=2005166 RepID=UPI002734F776|nr:undecaprenyl-diphosphate phosphatase [Tabrizicola sp.]MDP3194038.1 undecaprenyl-diphosphate phosphatase [Tabrizicola sp.]MDZ4069534.1 undecaprenyl-diphosphate phosphatase [Tabrizicola sp.]
MDNTLTAAFLGLLEGLTEFLPVSSTGHLLLAGHFLGFHSAGRTFEVVIQLGAILALFSVYATLILRLLLRARHEDAARRSIVSLLLAFLPAVVVGVLAHGFVKSVLFESPMLIAIVLILGGFVLLVIDRIAPVPVHHDALDLPFGKSLIIGFCQTLALVPGVSRSGATIVGALLMGVEKRAAAEFSFLLSLPTMGAAVVYDLYQNRDVLDFAAMWDIAVGFAVAFLTAAIVVRWVLNFIGKHGYALFGWWRIIVGSVALTALLLGY